MRLLPAAGKYSVEVGNNRRLCQFYVSRSNCGDKKQKKGV